MTKTRVAFLRFEKIEPPFQRYRIEPRVRTDRSNPHSVEQRNERSNPRYHPSQLKAVQAKATRQTPLPLAFGPVMKPSDNSEVLTHRPEVLGFRSLAIAFSTKRHPKPEKACSIGFR
eukprot:jgi/Psemu1/307783/fgenesh1_kg.352_\